MISIDLTNEDAELFRKFRQYQDTFEVLEEAGVFNVRNGQVVLSFDAHGTLGDIECTLKLYRRGLRVIPVLVDIKSMV